MATTKLRPLAEDDTIVLEEDQTPTSPRAWRPGDVRTLGICAVSAFSLVFLLFFELLPLDGAIGFLLTWYVAFLIVYRLVVRELEGPTLARDRMWSVVVATAAVLILVPLVLVIGYVVMKGIRGLSLALFTKDMEVAGPQDDLSSGGIAHAIVGTLEQVALAVAMSVPLGLLCAVFLNEIGGPLRRPVRIFVDAMSGVPTIVAGLFIYAVWEVWLGHGFSGFAAAMAISISMLPVITRTAEEVLRLVPDGLREASLALGTTEWRTTSGVVLPTARTGLVTAVILGVARAVGETAPLIMTSFGSSVMNANPFSGPQSSLPIYIYRQFGYGLPVALQRAWTAAMVLIFLVLGLFVLARVVGGRTRKVGGRRDRAAAMLAASEPAD